MNITMRKPEELIPYRNNVKKHSKEQIENVAASIKAFGFVQPVVVDRNNVIVIGHSRTMAAKKLGMKEIPVVIADALSEEEVKALRIADNKLNESVWDSEKLEMELGEIKWDMWDMDFDFTGDVRKNKAWDHITKRCNLKKQIKQTDNGQYIYTTLFNVTKDGKTLEEIKSDVENVQPFADCACWYIEKAIGHIGESWCLITTPKRRNKGFHFATKVCEALSDELGIPFYRDAVQALNSRRIEPTFLKNANPAEENIILYDDIITTGKTIQETRELFICDHSVLPIISIRNR